MKTLDEVVKALEICANNQRCIDGCPYYKLYKIASEKKQENLPLTWQELKQMEGKPVWLEFKDGRKFWTVILRADQIQDGSWMLIDHTDFYTKKDDVWQAYRKER